MIEKPSGMRYNYSKENEGLVLLSNKTDKPKLTSRQLVIKMRDEKGISFRYDSEDDAAEYLSDRNNYLRTACYRVSFQKFPAGANAGKYVNLDFAYLKELSVIDMQYRFLVKRMCSDIEHSISVNLLKLIENDPSTDGYDIVEQFLNRNPYVVRNIEKSRSSPHTGDLIKKYFSLTTTVDSATGRRTTQITAYDDCPAWVLCECLTFGDLASFYRFYCDTRGISMFTSWEVLNLVRSLRNGVSHDNCMLCNIPSGTSVPPQELTVAVRNLGVVSTSQRQKKLSSRTVLEFTALLYAYSLIVQGKVREHRVQELKELFRGRVKEKKAFFAGNNLITTTYEFACKMIEGFLPS